MLWALLAGLITGVLSGFGLGGGTLLMLYLTGPAGLAQQAAQGVNLLYFLPCSAGALWGHIRSRQVDFAAAWPAVLAGVATGSLSALAAQALDAGWLRRGFGLFVAVIGLRELLHRGVKAKASADSPPE